MEFSSQVDPKMRIAIKRLKGKPLSESRRDQTVRSLIVSYACTNVHTESGKYKVAALTNNFAPPTEASTEGQGKLAKVPSLEEELEHLGFGDSHTQLRKMFDHYIESAVVGKRYVAGLTLFAASVSHEPDLTILPSHNARKPDPEFYKHALDLLQVQASEVVFLDDIGPNLKSAQKLGITTIRECPWKQLQCLNPDRLTG